MEIVKKDTIRRKKSKRQPSQSPLRDESTQDQAKLEIIQEERLTGQFRQEEVLLDKKNTSFDFETLLKQ